MDWIEYFQRRPVGWRDDHRTHYLLAAQGVKAKPHELFASLYAIEKDKEELANESLDQDFNISGEARNIETLKIKEELFYVISINNDTPIFLKANK